jgi:hypothetical protein
MLARKLSWDDVGIFGNPAEVPTDLPTSLTQRLLLTILPTIKDSLYTSYCELLQAQNYQNADIYCLLNNVKSKINTDTNFNDHVGILLDEIEYQVAELISRTASLLKQAKRKTIIHINKVLLQNKKEEPQVMNQYYTQNQQQQPQLIWVRDGAGNYQVDQTGVPCVTDGVNVWSAVQMNIPLHEWPFQPQQQVQQHIQHHQHVNNNPYVNTAYNYNQVPGNNNPLPQHGAVNGDWGGSGAVPVSSNVVQQHVQNTAPAPVAQEVGQVPAKKSQWKRTWVINYPYPILFVPRQHYLVHDRSANGDVIEVLGERTEELTVDYFTHELRPDLRAQTKRDAQNAAGNKHDILKTTIVSGATTSEKLLAAKVDELPIDKNLQHVYVADENHNFFPATNLDEAVFLVKEKIGDLISKDIALPVNTAFTFSTVITDRFYETIPTETLEEIFTELREADTFETLADIMLHWKEVKLKNQIGQWWYRINDQMTTAINHAMKYGLGMTARISSFTADSKELLINIAKVTSPDVAEVVAEIQRDIIVSILNNWVVNEKSVDFNNVICATLLSAKACELNIDFGKEDYGLVSKDQYPTLHAGLLNLIRTHANLGNLESLVPNQYLLITADNRKLYLHNGLIMADSVLLSLTD